MGRGSERGACCLLNLDPGQNAPAGASGHATATWVHDAHADDAGLFSYRCMYACIHIYICVYVYMYVCVCFQ